MSSCGNPNCISCYLKGVSGNSAALNLPSSSEIEEVSEVQTPSVYVINQTTPAKNDAIVDKDVIMLLLIASVLIFFMYIFMRK